MTLDKQVLIVNDLSCYGKVATTVALPILNANGIETSVLPTVLLSTHTAYTNPYRHLLTTQMLAILDHFSTLSLTFDALLTGYFGDAAQIDAFLSHLPTHQLLIVDPVMADNGKLYSGFDKAYPKAMLSLCQKADIIIPNLTEACLLAELPYLMDYTLTDIQTVLYKLAHVSTCDTIVLTGIRLSVDQIGAVIYNKGHITVCQNHYIDNSFIGTGDLFSALLTAYILKDMPITVAVEKCLDFLVRVLNTTIDNRQDSREGILFEEHLSFFSH